jgi:hypothetical protein
VKHVIRDVAVDLARLGDELRPRTLGVVRHLELAGRAHVALAREVRADLGLRVLALGVVIFELGNNLLVLEDGNLDLRSAASAVLPVSTSLYDAPSSPPSDAL